MPPPKDPEKYALYIQRQKESHIGHVSARKGKKHSQKSIDLMKKAKEGMYNGEKNPFWGKSHSHVSIIKMVDYAKNRPESHTSKMRISMKGRIPWNMDIPCAELTKQKLRESQLGEKGNRFGKHHTPEACNQIRKKLEGRIKSELTCERIRKNRRGKCIGENNPNWAGGKFEYCYKYNERRRIAVRKFFGDLCLLCEKPSIQNIVKTHGVVALSVHHIDHDREQGCNGRPFNLIPLCHKCHAKELHHQREYKERINICLTNGFNSGKWSKDQYEIDVMYSE